MKQRSVNTSIWLDGWYQELAPKCKLLFLFLLTNPETNIAGIYEITLKTIEFHTGLSKEEIKLTLKSFEADGKVYRVKNYVIMVNHLKHQKLNPNMLTSVRSIISSVPPTIKDSEGYKRYMEAGKLYLKLELI